jgi:DsbC/DsbD-like thiol-disulfide interchange protein
MRRLVLTLAALMTAALSMPVHALESSWAVDAQAQARLLATRDADATIRSGIEIRLKQGWHTYWRYPGDAGVPPRFDWSGSENLAFAEVRWPAPARLVDRNGAKSIGYSGNVIFPVAVRAANPALAVKLKLKLDFAVCEKLCIPADAELVLTVPPTATGPLDALTHAGARVPRRVSLGETVGSLSVSRITLERGPTPDALIEVSAPAGQLDLFAEGPDDRWALPLPEKIESKDGKRRFRLAIDGAPAGGSSIPKTIVLTLVAEGAAIEVEAPLD